MGMCVNSFRIQKTALFGGFLLLGFFVRSALAAPFAILHNFNFALYFLFIFAAPISNAFALGTDEFYKSYL